MKKKSIIIAVVAVLALAALAYYYNWGNLGQSRLLRQSVKLGNISCDQSAGCNDPCFSQAEMAEYTKVASKYATSDWAFPMENLDLEDISDLRIVNKGPSSYNLAGPFPGTVLLTENGEAVEIFSVNSTKNHCSGTFWGVTPENTVSFDTLELVSMNVGEEGTTLELWVK